MENFWIHKDGYLYSGDSTEGAREATQEEINNHLNPQKSQEEQQKALTNAVQSHMDEVAQTKGYDNLLSAVTYAEELAVPIFQAEGIAFRAWRSAVWAYCYAQLAAVLNGERETPTVEDLIAELPPLDLPS